MGAEKGGAHPDGADLRDPPRGAEHREFRLAGRAIARLDLDGRHALRRSGHRRAAVPAREAVLPGRPRRGPRSTGCRHRRGQFPRRSRPASRISNSRARLPPWTMWVWQSINPGVTSRPSRSKPVEPGVVRGQVRLRADPGDPLAVDRDGAALDQPVGPMGIRPDERRIGEEHDDLVMSALDLYMSAHINASSREDHADTLGGDRR